MSDNIAPSKKSFLQNPLAKLGLILILVLLLQIPIFKIDSLVWERSQRFQSVITEIADKWGGEQALHAPVLVIPVDTQVKASANDYDLGHRKTEFLIIAPSALNTDLQLKSETRYRGIYEVPLYHSDVKISGNFDLETALNSLKENQELRLAEAFLSIGIGDIRAIQSGLELNFDEQELKFFPGSRFKQLDGIHARPDLSSAKGYKHNFNLKLRLHGSQGIFVSQLGEDSHTSIAGDWTNPSFQGEWLPSNREITEDGFTAAWQVPFLAKGQPAFWTARELRRQALDTPWIGVTLPAATGQYQAIERSVKYSLLFLACTFVSLWLVELTTGLRIHPIQYLFTGATLCLFYLLFLSFAEHLGTLRAYGVASLAVVCQLSWYCHQFLPSRRLTLAVTGLLTTLYGYLLSLLYEQDYALLFGTLGLFFLLALGMFLTRKIDWYQVSPITASFIGKPAPQPPQPG